MLVGLRPNAFVVPHFAIFLPGISVFQIVNVGLTVSLSASLHAVFDAKI
jgi:hypothetical protein